MNWPLVVLVVLVCGLNVGPVRAADDATVNVGSERQLFVDGFVLEKLDGARLELHHPIRREIVIRNDHPWEKYGVSYMVTFRDGGKFRAWYRCDAAKLGSGKRRSMTAYAESDDGIHWVKPKLGLIEYDGSKENNLVWAGPGVNMAVFKDENPAAPEDERYKAVVRNGDLHALVSPDGLRWRPLQKEPILTKRPFDSHNIAFWDRREQQYVTYTRGIERKGKVGAAMSRPFYGGVRAIRRATSKDFRNWSPLELIDTGDAPLEHLYTNAAIVYDRAPGWYLMFPSRYVDTRKPDPAWKIVGVNDVVLLSSRDGRKFDRTFMEAFVRPGRDPGNWHDRSLYMERGILHTSPEELSMYAMENWRLETVHIRRLTLRPDGFVSVRAPYTGSKLLTRPLRFTGKTLRLNYSTSAAGSIRVEIQEARGKPLTGFTLDDCPEIFGDRLDAAVRWKQQDDLSPLAGRTVRLQFTMRDADLYAFRFADQAE